MSPRFDFSRQRLDKVLAPMVGDGKPGFVVGVAHKGKVVYRRGFGVASFELPVPLDAEMRLRIGSATKHFCCLAIMLLAEDGRLSPDDSVRSHLPDLGEWADGVSLRRLMSHTSGARCSLDVLDTFCGAMSLPQPYETQLQIMRDARTTNFAPGTSWSYSNGGYVLLSEVIKRVSGSDFDQFCSERILRPAKLHATEPRPLDTDCPPNSASLHVAGEGGTYRRGIFGPEIHGEGNLISSVDDMLAWLSQMDSPRVGSQATWAEMRTPAVLNSGSSTGYGMGLFRRGYRGIQLEGHSGHVVGGSAQLFKAPGHDLDLVVLSNTSEHDAPAIAAKVIDSMFAGLQVPADGASAKAPLGAFNSRSTGRMLKLVEHSAGVAVDFGNTTMPVRTEADGSIHLPTNIMEGAVVRASPTGGVIWSELGVDEQLDAVSPQTAEPAPPAGVYVSAEVPVSIIVDPSAASAMRTESRFGGSSFKLWPVTKGLWQASSGQWGYAGVVEALGEGRLRFSSLRNRLVFSRAE